MHVRICPHCRKKIPLDRGYTFDEKCNLICGSCGKIAFPTDVISEAEISAVKKASAIYKHTKEELPPQD